MSVQIYFAGASKGDYPTQGSNLLVNTVDNGATDYLLKVTKEIIEKVKPRNLMNDSGGAALYEGEKDKKEILSDPNQPVYGKSETKINLSPEHVIRASLALQPDTIFSLDFPLQKKKTKNEMQKEFERKLPMNIEWARETSNLWRKHCSHMNLLIPVQSKTMEQFEWFMEELAINDIKYTGVSIPSRNIDCEVLVRYLIRFYELKVPWVHLLGSTRLSYMTILSYFAKHKLFKLISMDSRTWQLSGTKERYLNPENLIECKLSDHSQTVSKQLCNMLLVNSNEDRISQILCSHNSIVTVKLANDLYRNATSLEKLEKYVLKRGTSRQGLGKAIASLRLVGNILN